MKTTQVLMRVLRQQIKLKLMIKRSSATRRKLSRSWSARACFQTTNRRIKRVYLISSFERDKRFDSHCAVFSSSPFLLQDLTRSEAQTMDQCALTVRETTRTHPLPPFNIRAALGWLWPLDVQHVFNFNLLYYITEDRIVQLCGGGGEKQTEAENHWKETRHENKEW